MRSTQPPLSYIPLLPTLAGVVAGVLIMRYFDAAVWVALGAALIAAAAAIMLKWRIVAELMLATAFSCVTTYIALPAELTSLPDDDTEMTGRVVECTQLPESQRMKVKVDTPGGHFYADVTYATFDPAVMPGDVITFSGSYSFPRRDTDLPMEDDMAAYYYNNGISLLCYSPKGMVSVTGHRGNVFTLLLKWREYVVGKIVASGLDEQASAFVAAVLTGDDSLLPRRFRDSYAAAGVAHILALSGAHVAVIVVILSIVFSPLGWIGHRKARWCVIIPVLWLYALFTGLSPSVCRAVIMATAVMLSLILDRPKSSLNALCLAAMLILLFSPLSLFNAGFQLSFMATVAIIIFVPGLSPVNCHKYKGGFLVSVIITTLAATLGTMPLVAYRFHTLPVYFLIANLVAVAIIPAVMTGGVLLVLLVITGFHPSWLVSLLDRICRLFDGFVNTVAALPGAAVNGIYFDAWLILPMYIALAFLALFLYRKHKSYLMLCGATLLFVVGVHLAMKPVYADNEAYMVRSNSETTIAVHHGDTLQFFTTSPPHNFGYDRGKWSERYSDYIATRGIGIVDIYPLGRVALHGDGALRFGRRRMLLATELPVSAKTGDSIIYRRDVRADYCLVTAQWYGDPVALHSSISADTIVLSGEINRRRRNRYLRELSSAGIPVIDLSSRPLMSY